MMHTDELAILNRLLEHNPAPCPLCRRPLTPPLSEPRCGSCRRSLVVCLALATPMAGPIIAGAVGLGAALGFTGLLAIYLVIFMLGLTHDGPSPAWPSMLVSAGFASVSALLLAAWCSRRGRNWIRRRTTRTRWLLIAGCWLLPPLSMLAFRATIP